jgi:hypothetical protein
LKTGIKLPDSKVKIIARSEQSGQRPVVAIKEEKLWNVTVGQPSKLAEE